MFAPPCGVFLQSGHTFCTKESFDRVAQAVVKFAFVSSRLPIMLSLEMHCNPKGQRRIAMMLVKHMGDELLKVLSHSCVARVARVAGVVHLFLGAARAALRRVCSAVSARRAGSLRTTVVDVTP